MSADGEGKVVTRFTCDVCGHSAEIAGAWATGLPPDGVAEDGREGVPWARVHIAVQGKATRVGIACSGECVETLAARLHGDLENDPSRRPSDG